MLALLSLAQAGSGVTYVPNDGIVIDAEGSPGRLLIGGWVAPSTTRTFGADPSWESEIRRARLNFEARASKTVDLRLQIAMDQRQVSVLDAYGAWEPLPDLELRVGYMRPPAGLERETGSRWLPYQERLLKDLVPRRTEAIELSYSPGAPFVAVALARPKELDEWGAQGAFDLVGRAGTLGDTWELSVRGGWLHRPGPSPATSTEVPELGGDLLLSRAWTGEGFAFGADAAVLLGSTRLTLEGAGIREGVTLGTLDGHVLNGAGVFLVGWSPQGERGKIQDGAPMLLGTELTLRLAAQGALPAPGNGGAGVWALGQAGLSWTPEPGLRLALEGGPTWARREGEATGTMGGAVRAYMVVGL